MKSTEENRNEAGSNFEASETEKWTDADREESGNDGKIDYTKEGAKKKKKLKIIEVDSYDEIDGFERKQENESREEAACNGNKNKFKKDINEAESKMDLKKEVKDKKFDLDVKQKESRESLINSEGFPDDIMKMINEGDQHFEKGRYGDAMDFYTKALNALGPGTILKIFTQL